MSISANFYLRWCILGALLISIPAAKAEIPAQTWLTEALAASPEASFRATWVTPRDQEGYFAQLVTPERQKYRKSHGDDYAKLKVVYIQRPEAMYSITDGQIGICRRASDLTQWNDLSRPIADEILAKAKITMSENSYLGHDCIFITVSISEPIGGITEEKYTAKWVLRIEKKHKFVLYRAHYNNQGERTFLLAFKTVNFNNPPKISEFDLPETTEEIKEFSNAQAAANFVAKQRSDEFKAKTNPGFFRMLRHHSYQRILGWVMLGGGIAALVVILVIKKFRS